MTMDDRKLDRMARTAGILKNRVSPGEKVTLAGDDWTLDMGNLHAFMEDVLEMVALLRQAGAAVRDGAAAIGGAYDAGWEFIAPPEGQAVTITTDDVTHLAEEGMLGVAILDDEPE
jgi:hypothetical protein